TAQGGATLRQQVETSHDNVAVMIGADSGEIRMPEILERTDLAVRATIGEHTSRLTKDDRHIYTTYELRNLKVLFGSLAQRSQRPGEVMRPLTVAVNGGTVRIGAFSATVTYSHAPTLEEGMDVVLLLHREGDVYWSASDAGMFSVVDSKI